MKLTLTCWNYDRVQPLLDGSIKIPGIELDCKISYPSKIFSKAFTEAPFDISELSASSYIMQHAKGECAYIALPIFVSRAFRHGGFYINTHKGISEPIDLEGKRVGVPEYQMTMALWARGLLADEYGVNTETLIYRTGGTNAPGRKERLVLTLPDHIDINPISESQTLNSLLVSGELDAVIAPSPPLAFTDGVPEVQRLFPEVKSAEQDYFRRTGIFPIMHVIGVRHSLVENYPWLPLALFDAFEAARKLTEVRLKTTATASANRIQIPWLGNEWEETVALMGESFWTYGVDQNEAALTALCRYAFEQHLAPKLLSIDDLFYREDNSIGI
ncbi:MAG: hypothetical protein CBB68_03605 [Rhodospirillaceae bacterium TMED8]|nr:4,5-dihydroxyphthalate decarboxylase [Magnetovibrio sp.]OUT51968.1 MAG: hypothetical protein CBB68_03605 [Rhodospirillaceae bacterium TMED8]|tara:strand:+ start:830 stop:1819 length:990 start_codon:yes stop_codon:yes gene_type:complete